MSRPSLARIGIRPAVPARDLPFVDAVALLAALFVGYAVRAAGSPHYTFDWAGIAPFVRLALPVSLCALILSAAALGLYGERAAKAGLREHLAAVAYAAAVAIGVGIYRGGPSKPTVFVALTLTACLAVSFYGARLLYWRLATADADVAARDSGPETLSTS